MKSMELAREAVTERIFKPEMKVDIGNKMDILKRHFRGKRGMGEAINKIVINEAVRKTV